MRNSTPRVCIVVVSRNRLSDLERCLASIRNSLSPRDTVVIIDNHSNDRRVLDNLAQTFQQFHWEFNRTNLGFTGGNHQGIAWAMKHDFEYLFLLNPDTVIFPDTLQELLRASKSLKDQWIISPLLIRPGNHSDPVIDSAGLAIDRYYRAIDNFQGKRVSQTPLSSEIFPVFGLCGAAMLIPLGLFPLRKSSPHAVFRDDYFAYFEDAEFSWYWKNRGGHFGVCPWVRIEHHRGNRSLLRSITLNRWKNNRFVIEKMILNRYETISRHETRRSLLKHLPGFLPYEIARWLYIFLRKPYLSPLFFPCWRKILRKLIFNHPDSP